MWYRIAINLSNLSGFNSTETDVELKDGGIKDVPEKLLSGLEGSRDKLDELYHFGGLDPESEKFKNISNSILQVSSQLVPVLSSVVKIIEQQKPLQFLIKKQFSLSGIVVGIYDLLEVCKQLKDIEDPSVRVKRYAEYFKASGGLHGVATNLFAVFNSISKILNLVLHLNVHSPVDLSTVFMAFSIGEYVMEESREDEHKSGVNLIKTKVVNPHIDFLIKKNPKNKIVVNYVEKYIKDHPDASHEEVRENALKLFLRDEKKSKFKNISGTVYSYSDILQIVDNLYTDPHDLIPVLKGKRISKEYYDSFMDFLNNASMIQMKINRAAFNLSKLMLILPHL